MPMPRYGYGKALHLRLLNNLEKYLSLYGKDDLFLMSVSVLENYLNYHLEKSQRKKYFI